MKLLKFTQLSGRIVFYNRLLSKPRFLWIFKNLNPNTYKGLFLVWKEIYYEIHGQGEPVVVLHGGLVGS
ncbi:hypothetical protein B5J94_09550, partial [Moraxella lacunata]